MSLLSFKCEKCGHKVWKIDSIKYLFFSKNHRNITCKQCGSKYKIWNNFHWAIKTTIDFLLGVSSLFFILFFGMYAWATVLSKFKIDNLAIQIILLVSTFILSILIVSIALEIIFLMMSSYKIYQNKEK